MRHSEPNGLLVAGVTAAPGSDQGIGGRFAFGSPTANSIFAAGEVFSATPNPVKVCNGSAQGNTDLSWNIGRTVQYEVRRDSADGSIVKRGTGSSRYAARNVNNGSKFYLVAYRTERVRQGGRMVTRQVRDVVVPLTITHTTAGCVPAGDPPRVTCNPNPQNTQVGQAVTFTAAGGTGAYTWSAPGSATSDANSTGTSFSVSYSGVGDKSVTVTSGSQSAACQVNVSAAANPSPTPPAAATLACAAQPTNAVVGQTVTFKATGGAYPFAWSVSGAPGAGNTTTDSVTTSFYLQGDYAATVYSGGRSAQCSVRVGLQSTPPPPAPNPPPPPVQANQAPVSIVDTANCDQNLIKGWVIDPNTPNNSVQVRLLDGSTVLATTETTENRPDVNDYFAANYNAGHPISGNHGFSFDLTNHRADGKVHLFSLEAADSTTGIFARINLVSSANMVCQPIILYKGSIDLSYTKTVLIDKFNYSTITNTDNRDATTVTYKYEEVAVGDTIEVCPGPDGKPGRQNITVSGWGAPNGASITVTDSVSGQEKWFANWYGPTPQKSTWTAYLGPNQSAVTYTFKLNPGPNTVVTKTVQVRPMTGACDPAEYSQIEFTTDGIPYCPTKKQYPSLYARIVVTNAPSQPPRTVEDAIVLKFRPWGQPDLPQNYQTISVRLKGEENYKATDPTTFVFRTEPYKVYAKGYYMFVLNFRGKAIYQSTYEHVVPNAGPFCESTY